LRRVAGTAFAVTMDRSRPNDTLKPHATNRANRGSNVPDAWRNASASRRRVGPKLVHLHKAADASTLADAAYRRTTGHAASGAGRPRPAPGRIALVRPAARVSALHL